MLGLRQGRQAYVRIDVHRDRIETPAVKLVEFDVAREINRVRGLRRVATGKRECPGRVRRDVAAGDREREDVVSAQLHVRVDVHLAEFDIEAMVEACKHAWKWPGRWR